MLFILIILMNLNILLLKLFKSIKSMIPKKTTDPIEFD